MERWQNKVAVVTGASAGIGAACVKDLAKAGMIVVGLARRAERIEALRKELPKDVQARLHAMKCDVSNEKEIIETFAAITKKFGGVDVLVNNAGVIRNVDLLKENNTEDLRAVIDTNVMGVTYCTREAFKSMKTKNDNGHVILINSIAGHHIPVTDHVSLSIYPSSKYAITAMTEVYRQEFLAQNTKIKVTSISPGAVETDILPKEVFTKFPSLRAEDISDAVKYVIQTPPGVQIHELTIKPIGEKF